MPQTILIAEDDPVQREMLRMMLAKRLGYKVITAVNGKEAIARIEDSQVGDIRAVLLDVQMPVTGGFDALKYIRTYRPDLPVLMLTSNDDTATAVKAIKEGASDFIVKPPQPEHLNIAITNAIRLSALASELSKVKRDKEGTITFADLIGNRKGLADVVVMGRKAAACDVPVLLSGESGTGKGMFARMIHGESKRAHAPFVSVHCSSMGDGIEALLFGDERAPTSGARPGGKIRAADGGTLFLEDVTELPADAQIRLLRLLRQREIEPVGSNRTIRVNVRVISSTNRDIRREVVAGRFREDLYFRLNVLPIMLPPLRAHRQDILPMAEYFLERLAVSDRLVKKPLSADAIDYLTHHAWPGNVRALEGLMHRALVLCEGEEIDRVLLETIDEQATSPSPERRNATSLSIGLRHPEGHFKTMDEIEAEAMRMLLSHFDGNTTRAADMLGMAKSTFYRKLKQT